KETGLNDDIKEDDFLSLDELNDFLSMNESDLEVSSKKTSKQDREITDVSVDSDHKNTQCPATDDELDPFDDEEDEREKAIKRAEKKKRFELARQKNKVSGLDPFDDSEDDYYLSPKKKQTQDDKKQKIKPKMYFAGGGIK
ncbi:TPA: helix-turn-helix domain-containing protein, partial [Shigella sonnei]